MSTKNQDKIIEKISGNCSRCPGNCCRYIIVDLPTPRSRLDFDNYGWYLAHENTAIYMEEKKWYLVVDNKCRYLDEKNRCTVYDKRFQACRDHTDSDCEVDGRFEPDMAFRDPFKLQDFAEKKFSESARKRKLTLKNKSKAID
ncbi:MAG: YkgJ family cysteine cluster protein [candidate division Zixibacteria bacterium]|nr:YkgJ family cysteine cluster protein [candidate division Zixibacteria bacterium]